MDPLRDARAESGVLKYSFPDLLLSKIAHAREFVDEIAEVCGWFEGESDIESA